MNCIRGRVGGVWRRHAGRFDFSAPGAGAKKGARNRTSGARVRLRNSVHSLRRARMNGNGERRRRRCVANQLLRVARHRNTSPLMLLHLVLRLDKLGRQRQRRRAYAQMQHVERA